MRSARQSHFATVPSISRPRSVFDRSHGYKTTFDCGYLVPVYVDEVLPGDTFNLRMNAFCRLATPLHPVMDNLFLDTFFFFVPLRLIHSDFERMMGAQDNPGDSTDYVTPKVSAPSGGFLVGSLYDYFGVPTEVEGFQLNNYHARAYNLIYNDWFRDENLQDSVVVDTDAGPDDPADYVLLRRGKRHDYFTSALPFPQKGPAVELPLTGNAPVVSDGTSPTLQAVTDAADKWSTASVSGSFGVEYAAPSGPGGSTGAGLMRWVESGLQSDLSGVTAATINELREAVTIQQLYELDARGGTRYTEIVRAHFGAVSADSRLQRPEYLGGGSSYVNVSPVLQMSETTVDSPQGNLAGVGTGSFRGHGFSKSFTEHGVIIGLISARADLNYQQGLNRMFSRSTRLDFYWPTLANLGEQPVLNKEIYLQGTSADDLAFGYQERWGEYRYKPSSITGQFRSTYATSLDTWHLAQEFGALPTLGDTFIQENPPVDRIIAVPSEPHFLFDSVFDVRTVRVMPMYSVPGLRRF